MGKIWDYEKIKVTTPTGSGNEVWQHAPHKKLIHHISRSAIVWTKAVDKFPKYRYIEDAVLHAILAHHANPSWGSPVQPQTKTAWLLHLCDSISARMDDCETNKLYK